MTSRSLLLPLLFLGTVIAQDSAPPVSLSEKDHPPICRGKESDAPGCITAPHATYAPEPEYPKKESKARHRGTVLLELVVDRDGLPRNVEVSRPLSPDFDEAAINAVKTWRFTPATQDSKPIATRIKVEVSFRLY
jgi:TonB family protein